MRIFHIHGKKKNLSRLSFRVPRLSLSLFFFSFTPKLGLGAAKRSEMKPRSSQHHGQHPARPLPAPLRQNPEVAALA